MARMPRLVVPGYPHHVTQRGNRRMKTFFSSEDYQAYLQLIVDHKEDAGVQVLAYCLMPNHVHFIAVPQNEDSLAMLFGKVHRHYSRRINFRENWRGHLWQERFHSFVMDEQHLLAVVKYVELNPVKAGLCQTAEQWFWSSAQSHLNGRDNNVVTVQPMLDRIDDWGKYLSAIEVDTDLERIRKNLTTGRPLGSPEFVDTLEKLTGRKLKAKKPGPKTRNK